MKRAAPKQVSCTRKRSRFVEADACVAEAPRYDFEPLIDADKELAKYAVGVNGHRSIDFSSREATYHLTRVILRHHFDIEFSLPQGHLVPTIPSRVQYLRWAAGLLAEGSEKQDIVVLDIGTGPSCIYPVLGTRLFPQWKFIATDTDEEAIQNARHICTVNQLDKIIILEKSGEEKLFCDRARKLSPSLTVCNPPFHAQRCDGNDPPGTEAQLVTDGGEYNFVRKLAQESVGQGSVAWFTSLIGRKEDLGRTIRFLRSAQIRAARIKWAELCAGGRTTRWAVAWSFGDERTRVALASGGRSKWRHEITVSAGRKFGNQLEEKDILGVVRFALCSSGWHAADNKEGVHESPKCAFRGADQGRLEACELDAFVARQQGTLDFVVLLKVQDRGQLQAEDFKQVCLGVKEKMLTFLRQLESST